MANKRVLGIILAGGKGARLHPLTQSRTKAAVLFGGKYRLIDFVLSNFINSQIYSIYILTQFLSQSLLNHIKEGWQFGSLLSDHFIIPVPAQMQNGERWYQGTADAIYQNIELIKNCNPDIVAIFGADHVYRMDIRQMVEYHVEREAKVTIAVNPVPAIGASSFGVIEIDRDYRIIDFQEKPEKPKSVPDNPNISLASMGNYLFETSYLLEEVIKDAREESEHDFGKAILPKLVGRDKVYAYNFQDNKVPGEINFESNYWKDVGTIEAYYESNMDLKSVYPKFNLYNNKWPLRTASHSDPPAKFVVDEKGIEGRALRSVISEGCIISGGTVIDSVLGRNVTVDSNALVEDSILLNNVEVGKGVKIKKAIIDKNIIIPENATVGYNLEEDRKKFRVTNSGIVVIPKNYVF